MKTYKVENQVPVRNIRQAKKNVLCCMEDHRPVLKSVSQLKAYTGTRTLGIFGSSGSRSVGSMGGGGHAGSMGGTPKRERGYQIFNPETADEHHRYLIHAHLIFDNSHRLTFKDGEKDADNIGYAQGGLFNENYNYKTIGHPLEDEGLAAQAVEEVHGNFPNNGYDLWEHNCQVYVNAVYSKYHELGGV